MGLRLERIKDALDGWSLAEIRQIVDAAEGTDPESLTELHKWLAHGMAASSTRAFDSDSQPPPRRRLAISLGRLLIDNGLISEEALDEALEDQASSGKPLAHWLIEKGLVAESDLTQLLADQYGVPIADFDELEMPASLLQLVPQEMARRYQVVPLQVRGKVLEVAMVDPSDVVAMDDLKFATGLRIQPMLASERAVGEAIERLYGAPDDSRMLMYLRMDSTGDMGLPGERASSTPLWQGRPSIERWIRLSLSPDVELSYRERDDPLLAKKVEQLRRHAEELFNDEGEWTRRLEEILAELERSRAIHHHTKSRNQEE